VAAASTAAPAGKQEAAGVSEEEVAEAPWAAVAAQAPQLAAEAKPAHAAVAA